MPGTLRRAERTDSGSSRDSTGLVRLRPLGTPSKRRYISNGSGVTRVNLNGESSSVNARVARSLHTDTRVNRLSSGRVDEDPSLIEFVKPTTVVGNRYVRKKAYVATSAGREVEGSYGSRVCGGGSLSRRKAGSPVSPPRYQPDTPPNQRRNHVWNIVNQFDRESKQRYVGQHSDDDGASSRQHSPWPHDSTNDHLDMNKAKRNPITNGIKVIFGLKSAKKSKDAGKGRSSPDTYNSGERVDRVMLDRSGRTVSEENERNVRHGNRLGLLKTATENSRRGQRRDQNDVMEEDRSELTTIGRTMSPDQDVTDGYSTSKTFEYYGNDKGLDNYDSIRDYYLNKYREEDSPRATPELLSDYRPESPASPVSRASPASPAYPASPASPPPAYSSTQKTMLANGASEYVFRSSDGVNHSDDSQRDMRKSTDDSHRDMHKSTGDLEYRNKQVYSDRHGGSQPDIYRGRMSGDEAPSSRGRYTSSDLRSRGYVTTIIEDDIDRRSPYGSLEREGKPLPREVRSPDSRYSTLERIKITPSHDLDARPMSREYETLESSRYRRSNRVQSPDIPEQRRRRYGSTSSIDSSHEKIRSWERRGRERGQLRTIFTTGDEPTYSTIDKKNKINRRLDYSNSREQREFSGGRSRSEAIYGAGARSTSRQSPLNDDDDQSTLRKNRSRQDYGYDATGKYNTGVKQSIREARMDRGGQMQLEKVDRRDRSSSGESVQRHVERSHNKQVMRDDDQGFDQTVEEENYKDVTVERVDADSDNEQVIDVTNDSKTEEYEKDGHYHKQHKQSSKETKTYKYNLPDVVETLRSLSRPVDDKKRISDKPYNNYETSMELRKQSGKNFADVTTSIEKSKDENRYREGTRDIHDRQALNRAVVETMGTVDREYTEDGHKDLIVRDHNDYRQTVDHRTTFDDSDPMRKIRTKATVDKVDHYRTVDERKVTERLEKKPPSLERSRRQLKHIEAPEKPPRGSKSKKALVSIGDKLRAREKESESILRREDREEDAVYTKVKKPSKFRSESGKKWSRDHSSDEENDPNYAEVRYKGKEPPSSDPGRYRDLTKGRHASGEGASDDEMRRSNQYRRERRTVTKLYHDPVEASIEKNSADGWVTRKKETYVTSNLGADSSSPSPPLRKRSTTIERTKNADHEVGKAERQTASRTASNATDNGKDETTFHHYKQYKGKHGPAYPSIRITLSGKENGENGDGQTTTRSNKYQRGKLPSGMQMRNGSVDRLDVPPASYHSSTLQHTKRSKVGAGGMAVKRSSSSATGVSPVQRLRNNNQQRGISPMRNKNNTSSSADSIAGESTTSSRRAVGFYIPAVNHEHRKSLDDLGSDNKEKNGRAASVARSHSVLSGAGSTKSGLRKYREKTTTYAMKQPHANQVEKDDEIYGSTRVIDYSKTDEEDDTAKQSNKVKKNTKNAKVKRTASLPKDTRFPWLFRKKKKEKTMTVVKE